MKTLSLLALVLAFQAGSLQAEPAATKDKITRDEAQHLALNKVPNSSVRSARLEQVNGRGIWLIEVAKRGTNKQQQILVDATSGRIVPALEPAAPAEGPKAKEKK